MHVSRSILINTTLAAADNHTGYYVVLLPDNILINATLAIVDDHTGYYVVLFPEDSGHHPI